MRIGIDIGGTSIKIGVVNAKDEIIARTVVLTKSSERDAETIILEMIQAIKDLVKSEQFTEQERKETLSIGIACPGMVDAAKGKIIYSNNLNWKEVDMFSLLYRELGSSIKLGLANDADAAALGEVIAGAAKGKNSAVLLTLGTGVGGGVIINKKVFEGPLVGGCELGHMVIESDGVPCTCGRKGCLEVYASATALMRQAREATMKYPDSLMKSLADGIVEKIDGRIIFEAEKQGDQAAVETIKTYEKYLSIGIANIINMFRPEVIILGGGVSAQGEYLTKALEKQVEPMCYGQGYCQIPPICISSLGNDAGIIGAAYLTV